MSDVGGAGRGRLKPTIMKYIKYGLVAVASFFAALAFAGTAIASVTFSTPNQGNLYKNYNFFTATTTTATSTNTSDGGGYFVINGAKKVVMYFTHGGVATTSTKGAKFAVQASPDGSTWVDFNKLLGSDLSSTATSTYTIQGATTTAAIALDLSDDTFYAIRCISTELASPLGTDGEQTCSASAEF